MDIFYKQEERTAPPFSLLGISRCYFKHLCIEADRKNITTKSHHHTGFEIHIIENGHQEYAVGESTYTVAAGQFLLIPPAVPHRIHTSAPHTAKYSVTFQCDSDHGITGCCVGQVTDRMRDTIAHIVREAERRYPSSAPLIAGWVFELAVQLLRLGGMQEIALPPTDSGEDTRCLLAKQYIKDNVEQAPSIRDIAQYCHLSEKQLSRLFAAAEGCTVAEYIRAQRIGHIETLLTDRTLSLREISERMNFSSEHYFNAFFKKNAGMTPGKFRSMQT